MGFEFRASVTLDMQEVIEGPKKRLIVFKLVDSRFFSEFDGKWIVEVPHISESHFIV